MTGFYLEVIHKVQ